LTFHQTFTVGSVGLDAKHESEEAKQDITAKVTDGRRMKRRGWKDGWRVIRLRMKEDRIRERTNERTGDQSMD